MEKMHNFYCAHIFINFLDIYCWMFLLFTARLLFKHLLWWAILCASLSLQVVFLGPYYNLCWMQPRLWVKMCFSHFNNSLWAIFQAPSRVSVLASQISYWQQMKIAPNMYKWMPSSIEESCFANIFSKNSSLVHLKY